MLFCFKYEPLGDQNVSKQPGGSMDPRAPQECLICFFPGLKMSHSLTKGGSKARCLLAGAPCSQRKQDAILIRSDFLNTT